jgi:drug/metabolite transporter (DMT)-like permease
MKAGHLFQLLLLSAVWGVSFLLIRIAGDSLPPLWVALLRCSTGAVLLWSVMAITRRSLPPRRLLPWLLLVALFNNAIPFTCFAWGERTIPSNMAAVINAATPIWTLLITLAVQRIQVSNQATSHAGRVTARLILGVLLSFAGVLLVVLGHASADQTPVGCQGLILGAALVVCATLAYGIAIVAAKTKLRGLDPIGLATTQLTLASLMLLPAAITGTHPAAVSAASLIAIAILGLAGSGLAYLLYYNLLAHTSATHVAAVSYLTPIWGLFWGLLAHETIGYTAYIGVAVVIAGLLLMNWQPKYAVAALSRQ